MANVKRYPTTFRAETIENILHEKTDGIVRWIAVEVFDDPMSEHNADGDVVGPWFIGPDEEVHEHIKSLGLNDYSVQYEVGFALGVCVHCDEPIEREGHLLVCTTSGDEGGTYDFCEASQNQKHGL